MAVGLAAAVLAILIKPAPAGEQRPSSDFKAELAAALRLPVLLCYASIAFSLLAFFVMVAYIVPFLTVGGGLPLDTVPLALLGIGITGFRRQPHRWPARRLESGRAPCSAPSPSTPFCSSFSFRSPSTGGRQSGSMLVIWCVGFVFPAPAQTRIMREVADAPSFAASLNNTSFQVGIACGAAIGGAALASGWAYTSLPLLSALGFACALACTLALCGLRPAPPPRDRLTVSATASRPCGDLS